MLFESFFSSALIIFGAVHLDQALGEPKRWHPLIGFGRIADALEPRCPRLRVAGLLAWIGVIAPPVSLVYWIDLELSLLLRALFDSIILYLTIGARSLMEHAEAIRQPLATGNVMQARQKLAYIVSRDTTELDEPAISRAAIESVLENGADAVFAAIFWFLLLGAPGAILYRLANTLDAMWGYRTPRFLAFGWAAARIDDGLNFLPARLTALGYCLCGNYKSGFHSWFSQAKTWYSPNAGPVMAAGAGALQVTLGGSAVYHGKNKSRPMLGCGLPPKHQDIRRACRLLRRSIWLWLFVIIVGGVLHA